MSNGAFRIRINEACELMADLQLERYRNPQAYGQPDIAQLRQMSYFEQWKRFQAEYAFDIQLADLSLMQFRPQPMDDWPDAVSFIYLGCPLEVLSYRDWLITVVGYPAEVAVRIRDEYLDDYEEYVGTCDLRINPTYIRYDYSPHQYTANEHPAAHVHIGFDNHIRLGTRRLWNPLSFALFIVRQVYPLSWRAFKARRSAANSNNDALCKHIRENLRVFVDPLWGEDDEREAFLI